MSGSPRLAQIRVRIFLRQNNNVEVSELLNGITQCAVAQIGHSFYSLLLSVCVRERGRVAGLFKKKEICVLYSGEVQLPFLFVLNNVAADH